jgi:hypothetical protein
MLSCCDLVDLPDGLTLIGTCSSQLREAVVPLVELWDLMDLPEEERRSFRKATAVLRPAREEALSSGVLSIATIKKVHCHCLIDAVFADLYLQRQY